MIAVAVGFFGVDALHSHVTGVDRAIGIPGVGFALKQHQRAWALERAITRICWTFVPLVARNAYFNLHKLGARATEYLTDFYAGLPDGVNRGDPTDRLYIVWDLESPAAVSAAAGHPVDLDAAMSANAVTLVDRAEHGPVVSGERPTDGRAVRVAVPQDVEALRGRDPAAAARWRYAVRAAVRDALAAGYRVAGISRDDYYLLVAS
jgi:predicted GNAT superfamily acetyltransferase